MKLRRFAILSSVFACYSVTALASTTWVVDNDFLDCPQADFNSIQAAVLAAQPGDKVLVCPGTYTETPTPSTQAVLVNKSDLRIEAQGAPGAVLLLGEGQLFGFHLLNATGVVLQGFTVENFDRGNIRITGGSGNTVRKNVTQRAVVNDGIQVVTSSANIIEHNTSIENPQDGIFVGVVTDIAGPLAFDNIIRHNDISGNRHGINLNTTGTGNIVFGNRSYGNDMRGIQNLTSNANILENNHVFKNAGIGMLIAVNSDDVIVRNNRIEENSGTGINVAGNSERNLVEKNELLRNGVHGVQLNNNADANMIRLNFIRSSGADGIRVVDAASGLNTIEGNVIQRSGEHDAHDDSAGPGTGGTANFWINNKCATENRPELCKHPDL